MKKNYEVPEVEINAFVIEDVVTASSDPDFTPGENETEGGGGL